MSAAPPSISITGSVCALCREFISDLFAFDFTKPASYPAEEEARWEPGSFEFPGWGDGFRHHATLADLAASAATCEVCHVFHADLAPLAAADMCEGWLGLYPFWAQGKYGGNKRKGHFRAGFRGSLTRMPRGSNIILSDPLHSFRICLREHMPVDGKAGACDNFRKFHAVPASADLEYVSRTVARWRRDCREKHPDCARKEKEEEKDDDEWDDHHLPTRVLDVGTSASPVLRLYETSEGEKAPYTTLSHCWGGPIPAITTEANKAARTAALDFDDLPQNFRDAVQVTRALGIRYLWIDSLCIVQDSKTDWIREAHRMALIYAGAAVVISALDSPASTTGFLNQSRAPVAVLNDEYAVQKLFPQLFWYLHGCPLVGRGWCMQERLLAPTILHFGREQLFWECRAGFRCEDELEYTGERQNDTTAKFIDIRSRIGRTAARGAALEWRDWYRLLEEYTSRALTVPSDKLPALAGAAALFKSTRSPNTATYVAGLWKEDIKAGLLWAAHYEHVPGQKVYGPSGKISKLSRPTGAGGGGEEGQEEEERVPSWSWALVDGQVDFWALRLGSDNGFEVLDVTMSAANDHELSEAHPKGTIRIKGLMARMFYHPHPDGYDPGILTFGRDDDLKDSSGSLSGCLMDVNRRAERFCLVALAARSSGSWLLLVLKKRGGDSGSSGGGSNGGSCYRRIGMCISHSVQVDAARFQTREILIS